jgi:tetratricopeptide (TPR) repeat protein
MGIMDKEYLNNHRMKVAAEYESAGKYLHALQIYKSMLQEDPSCSDAVIKIADNYRKIGKIDAVSEILKNFIAEYPEKKEVRFYFSEFLLSNSEWEEAIEVLNYFTQAEDPTVAFLTGYSYFMLKDYEISKINFSNYISLSQPGEFRCEAFFFLSKIEIELQNYKAALENLKKAEPALNNFWEYNYLSALVYYHLGMYAHGVSLAKKAVNLNPNEPLNYNITGRIYLKIGDYPKAEKYLRQYISLKEDVSADVYAFLAEACFNNKKTAEAIELFDKALNADPENKIALDGKKNAADYMNRIKVSDG